MSNIPTPPPEQVKFLEDYMRLLPLLGVALLGGMVRMLQAKESFNFYRMIAGLITSGFTGAIVYFLISDLNISENVKAACIGIAGYSGGDLLPWLVHRLGSILDADFNKKKEPNEERKDDK